MKKLCKKLGIYVCVLTVVSSLLAGGLIKLGYWIDNLMTFEPIAMVNVARAEAVEEMPLRLWAMNLAYENGIDPDKFDCVIRGESGWNENAYNVNKNGSFDLGIAQWNSLHIKSGYIKLACVADPTCAIKKMIEKVKKDKGFKAWVAWKACK